MHYLPPSPFPASWHRRVVCAALLSLASMGAAHAAESELAHITVQTSGTTASWSSADAVVEAVRDTVVAAQVPGAVVQLLVQAGDKVQAGQELVRLDAQAAQQNAQASAAQVEAARSQAQLAEKELVRQRQLAAKQYISQAGLERAQAQLDAAQAQVRALQAQAGAASAQSGFYVVRAPFAGIVSDVPVSLGDMAGPGRPLVRLYDPRQWRITATAPQAWGQQLPAGSSAQLEIPALGPERLTISAAALQRLPRVDALSHTVQWRTTLPQGLEGLAPGMFARLWLPAAGTSTALASVPHSAVVRRAEMTGVYVLNEQGQPRLRQVRLGRVLPAAPGQAPQVEILSGLRNGERVATDPQAAAQVR